MKPCPVTSQFLRMLHEEVINNHIQRCSHRCAIFLLESRQSQSSSNSMTASTCKTYCSTNMWSFRTLFLTTHRVFCIGTFAKILASKLTRYTFSVHVYSAQFCCFCEGHSSLWSLVPASSWIVLLKVNCFHSSREFHEYPVLTKVFMWIVQKIT
jgi:hypothetical protein